MAISRNTTPLADSRSIFLHRRKPSPTSLISCPAKERGIATLMFMFTNFKRTDNMDRKEQITQAMRQEVFPCPSPSECRSDCRFCFMDSDRKKHCLQDFAIMRGREGAEWADKNPMSKYNLSDVDLLVSQLDCIINNAERLTTGNLAHNRASILLMARMIKNKCFKLKE